MVAYIDVVRHVCMHAYMHVHMVYMHVHMVYMHVHIVYMHVHIVYMHVHMVTLPHAGALLR